VSGRKRIDLTFRFFFRDAVSFLNEAQQLIALAGDDIELVIGELAPLLADLAFELFPIAFDGIPVHDVSPDRMGLSLYSVPSKERICKSRAIDQIGAIRWIFGVFTSFAARCAANLHIARSTTSSLAVHVCPQDTDNDPKSS
jgi:hypothetical protein